MKLQLWNARDPTDRRRWLAAHDGWPTREVFAHPAYVDLHAGPTDTPYAAFAEGRAGLVLYPFVLREIDAAHLRGGDDGSRADIVSPYGYGGAFRAGALDTDETAAFWHAFDDFCRDSGVVTEFTRLSLLEGQRLHHPGETTSPQDNVVVDLRLSDADTWRRYEHKVRKNVNTASRNGVTVEVDHDGRGMNEFLAIYETTMQRRDADARYFFPRVYFEGITALMSGSYCFFHARHDGRVVSTELVLVSSDTLYSFLGGTLASAFEVRPNDLLKHEIIRWGRAHGAKRFVLGGGRARDDGIFRFKRSFAPYGVVEFKVNARVHARGQYEALTRRHLDEGYRRDRTWQPDCEFFPAYRVPLPADS
jgi:hypothetical protein